MQKYNHHLRRSVGYIFQLGEELLLLFFVSQIYGPRHSPDSQDCSISTVDFHEWRFIGMRRASAAIIPNCCSNDTLSKFHDSCWPAADTDIAFRRLISVARFSFGVSRLSVRCWCARFEKPTNDPFLWIPEFAQRPHEAHAKREIYSIWNSNYCRCWSWSSIKSHFIFPIDQDD